MKWKILLLVVFLFAVSTQPAKALQSSTPKSILEGSILLGQGQCTLHNGVPVPKDRVKPTDTQVFCAFAAKGKITYILILNDDGSLKAIFALKRASNKPKQVWHEGVSM